MGAAGVAKMQPWVLNHGRETGIHAATALSEILLRSCRSRGINRKTKSDQHWEKSQNRLHSNKLGQTRAQERQPRCTRGSLGHKVGNSLGDKSSYCYSSKNGGMRNFGFPMLWLQKLLALNSWVYLKRKAQVPKPGISTFVDPWCGVGISTLVCQSQYIDV